MAWFRKKTPQERERKALAKAKKIARRGNKFLKLVPPEGVPLNFELASLGQRLGAQITDFIVTMLAAIVFAILFILIGFQTPAFLSIAIALLFFLIRVPYYIITELVWNGRTLAKRWLGLRVVSVDGRSLTAHQVVTRNIMKEVEFFAPLTYMIAGSQIHWIVFVSAVIWMVILLIVPWRSKNTQRIGDIIANTAVIVDAKPVLLHDLADQKHRQSAGQAEEQFIFTTAHLDQYGAFELQVLEKVLRAGKQIKGVSQKRQDAQRAEIVSRIVKKIGFPETVHPPDHLAFLETFYRVQRAHLESRKLFGDQRDDKFFKQDKAEKTNA